MLALPISVNPIDTIHHADCFVLMDWLYRAGIQVDLIASDMPYGTTACAWDKRVDLDRWWVSVKRVLKPRGVFLTTASQPFTSMLVMSNLEWFRYEWIWEKSLGTGYLNANRNPMKSHENILIFYDSLGIYNPQFEIGEPYCTTRGAVGGFVRDKTVGGYVTSNNGKRYPKTVLRYDNDLGLHNTQKPIALYEYLIRTYTQPGDVVLDPFCGSGTTGLAALRTGRRYILGDSDLGYVEAARKRIQNADPFQPSQVMNDTMQLSLFAKVV